MAYDVQIKLPGHCLHRVQLVHNGMIKFIPLDGNTVTTQHMSQYVFALYSTMQRYEPRISADKSSDINLNVELL